MTVIGSAHDSQAAGELTKSTGTADLRATGGGEAGDAADTVSMSAAANAGRAEQCSSNAVQSEL